MADLLALANAISTSSAKIKASCVEHTKRFLALEARVATLEGGTVPTVPTVPVPPATPPTGAYWVEDFETGTVGQLLIEGPSTGNIVRVAANPAGAGKVLELTTVVGAGGPNATSRLTAAYVNSPRSYGAEGQDVWYRTDILLPAGYMPAAGNQNWMAEWHISGAVPQNPGGVSCAMGVRTDYNARPNNPRWWLRACGGNHASYTEFSSDDAVKVPIQTGRWTTHLFHVRWSQGRAGAPAPLLEWYMDGVLRWTHTGPNLFLTSSGLPDLLSFGAYHYHYVPIDWKEAVVVDRGITVYHDNLAVGPTRASVGG